MAISSIPVPTSFRTENQLRKAFIIQTSLLSNHSVPISVSDMATTSSYQNLKKSTTLPCISTSLKKMTVPFLFLFLFLSLPLVFSISPSNNNNNNNPNNPNKYRLALQNLYVSHGIMRPPFSPDIFSYEVHLEHAHDQIAITPEIDQSRAEYSGGEKDLPVVTLKWEGRMNNQPESASVAVRRQIDLPDRGGKLDVLINVANPRSPNQLLIYTVTVYQSKTESLAVLKSWEVTDNLNSMVPVEPFPSQDNLIYGVYVQPAADSIYFTPHCADGNWVTLNGRNIANGDSTTIRREKNHHRQIVELTCGQGHLTTVTKKYVLAISSNYPINEIPHPRLVVSGRGKDCSFIEDSQKFSCPNPKAADYKTRLLGFSDPTIRYTLESYDKSVQIRLLNEVLSIPFTYTGVGDMYILALSGQHNVTWPIEFGGVAVPGVMRMLGGLLGLLLALLLISLLTVLSFSNTMGIGTPIGVTEIAAALTLMYQFFCFSSVLRGNNLLSDMTEAIKWTTLYWPLPWDTDTSDQNGPSTWGDVTSLTNAYGCLFWSLDIFLLFSLLHIIIILRFKCSRSNNTFPHRLKIGNWEARCLNWLAFPVATASGMVLVHPDATPLWKVFAGSALSAYFIWSAGVFFIIRSAVENKKVIWIWQASSREDGELEDESGYWSDVLCDQLLTQPVNRSLCKWFFPWKWVTTVADIDPIMISRRLYCRNEQHELEEDDDSSVYPVDNFHRSHKEPLYPLGKTPKTVDVIRTLKSGVFCPGQRMISGLLRTSWLDILFTYQGITKFHSQMSDGGAGHDFAIPLTVKTCQLTGSVTGGANHFFYDGARKPFIRIADTLLRLVVGLCIGVTLASDNYKLDGGMFAIVSLFAILALVYHCVACPYSRRIENWILSTLLITIATNCLSFMSYSFSETEPSLFADLLLWMTCLASFLLSAYACLVIFSVYSAIACPPLEETRFLEKLANCNVSIADSDGDWAVEVPAYNKYGSRDLKAQCLVSAGNKVHVSIYPSGEESTIEFDSLELVQACSSGSLRPPVLSLYCPDTSTTIGYRHMNLYDRSSLQADVAGFLAADRSIRYIADEVARDVAHQVAIRSRGKTIITMSVVLPKHTSSKGGGGGRDSSTSTTSMYSSTSRDPRANSRYKHSSTTYSSVQMTER